MAQQEPLLSVAGLTVTLSAGHGAARADVQLIRAQHHQLAPGALLSIVGGSVTARAAVLEVLAGRRPPDSGTLVRRVATSAVRQHCVSEATAALIARSWSHLPGAARRGRLSATGCVDRSPRLHLVLADGAAPVDRPMVAQLVGAARSGDGLVLALPAGAGLPAVALRGWRLDGASRVAALSMAS
jgi:ABC-type taurine transport system ATPase subunit